jgi:hypothetical protein
MNKGRGNKQIKGMKKHFMLSQMALVESSSPRSKLEQGEPVYEPSSLQVTQTLSRWMI